MSIGYRPDDHRLDEWPEHDIAPIVEKFFARNPGGTTASALLAACDLGILVP